MGTRYIFLLITLCLTLVGKAQTDTEFWFAVPEGTSGHGGSEPVYLHLAALDAAATVTIDMPRNATFAPTTFTIPAKGSQRLDLTWYVRTGYGLPPFNILNVAPTGTADPNNIMESGLAATVGTVENKGVRIVSNSLITAYLERRVTNNPEIWALKGKNAKGTNFYVPSQTWRPNGNYTPTPYNAVDVVATEDVFIHFTSPASVENYGFNSPVGGIKLLKGQSICLRATTRNAVDHLGGIHIWSDGKITVQWKDDSVYGDGGCYDMNGDQMIPVDLAGNEYVVMRGQLTNSREYVWLIPLQSGTIIDLSDVDGYAPASINLGAPGTQTKILLNNGTYSDPAPAPTGTIDALHMKSRNGEPFLVYHVSGFGCEMGAAVLPTIKGCTGSTEVSFQRATRSATERFFLNIMTKEAHIDDFFISINGFDYAIPNSWFTEIPGTGVDATSDWWYLDKSHNDFSEGNGAIPAIPLNTVCKVYNTTGIFHLGLINGGPNSGCRYGYFSDFSDNFGSAYIAASGSDYIKYCYSDTIQLQATGGLSYLWENYSTPFVDGTFIDPKTISTPRVVPPSGFHTYEVNISRACYPGSTQDTQIYVQAYGYPEIKAAFDTTQIGCNNCSPYEMKYINQSIGANKWEWTFERVNDTLHHIIKDPEVVYFSNKNYTTKEVKTTLKVSYTNNCPDTVSKMIPIRPEITASATKGSKAGCQQDVTVPYTIDTVGAGPITSVYWNWGDGDELEVDVADLGSYTTDSIRFEHTFENLTNFDTSYYVTLVFIDNINDCRDTLTPPFMDTVYVPGVARARFTVDDAAGCSPHTVNFENQTNGVVTYLWDFGEGTTSTSGADRAIIYTNNTASPIDYYVDLTITKANDDGSFCYDTYLDTITVYPEFTTTINTSDPLAGCNPHTVDFSQTTVPDVATEYYWDFGNGSTSGNADPSAKLFQHFEPIDKTYTVSLITKSQYACADTATPVDVTVYAYVDALFTVSDTVGCSPLDVEVENITSTNSVNNLSWVIPDNIGSDALSLIAPFTVQFQNTGHEPVVKTISLLNNNGHAGCDVAFTKNILVNPEFTADFTPSATLICHNQSITFTDASVFNNATPLTAGANITYYWEFGDGTTSSQESPTHVFKNTEKNGTTPQQFTVKLTVTAYGCTKVVTHTVEVYPEVKAVISADAYELCTPGTVVLTRQTEGAASFTWSFDDGTPPSNSISPYSWPVDHSMADPDATETKVVTLTATNDMCSAVTTKNFVVHPHLLPSFTADVTSGCNPLTVNFNNTSTGGTNLSYHWDFADGSEGTYDRSAAFSHEFVNTTPANNVFTVELTATNAAGCIDTFGMDITVLPFVDARFNVDRTVVCSPEPVQVTNATPANALVTSSVWDLGNGTGTPHATNPFEVSFVNLGTAPITDTIRLTNSNGTAACDVSFERVITINPEISPEFTRPAGTDTVCDNTTLSFTNTSYFTGVPTSAITAATPTASFLWNFGDGSTSTSENPLKVFKNTSGSTGTTPQKYVISLTLTVNGCTQVFTDSVYVKPVVKAQLNTPETQLCNASLISMANNSVGAGSYLWEFSDGTLDVVRTDKSSVSFTAATTNLNDIQEITVYLTASNGACSHTDSLILKVYPTVVPQIAPDIAAFCGPDTVSFSNTTLGGNAGDNQLSYLWDFGDGSTSGSTAATVEHRFGNTSAADKVYTITLTATNPAGCTANTTTQVTVYPEVEARFTFIKNSECHPVNVFLDNNSMNGTLYQWDFGYNGETLDTVARDFYKVFTHTNPDPNLPSTYTIWMKALDENHPQCSDSVSRQITIYPPVVPQFAVSDGDVVCYPELTEFTNSSTGYDLSYIWDYRDGNTSSALDPVHTHLFENRTAADKTYEVKLMVFDGNGCSATTTQNVVAHPRVLAGFTFKKDAIDKCTPIPVAFTYPSSALNGNQFTWNFGDGTPQENKVTKDGFTHVFDNPDPNNPISYSISLRATDTTTGCYHDTTRNIRIFPRLLPQFDQDVLEGCNPLEVAFENQTTGMASYSWNFGDNQTSIETDPIHVFTNLSLQNRDYNVVLTASQDSTGCILTSDTVITVYSYVNAVFGLQAAAQEGAKSGTKATLVGGCTPFNAVITDSSKVNGSKLWDFGDLFSIADSTATKHYLTYLNNDNSAPLEDTTYIIKLKLTNNEGCMDSTEQSLIVYPRPVANFTGDLAGCHPFTTNIVNQSEANDSYNYYWELSDGSTIVNENFTHTFYNYNYEQPKIFNIKLTASSENECSATYEDQVTVYPKPLAVIVPDIDRNCSPFNVNLENASQGTALSYYWDYDDGTGEHFVPSGANQQITLTNTSNTIQTYTVKLRTVTGFACSDTVEQPIIVYPEVRASFTPVVTEGCSPIEINFTNTSSPVSADGATVFEWNFGDAITSTNKNVMHRYVNESGDDQQYVVSLYAASVHGCDSSITDTITVYISPNAEFIVRNPIMTYPDTVYEFRNVAKEGPWSYLWNFGDGHSSTEDSRDWFTHAYEKWGPISNNFIDTVRFLIYSEHCSDESYQLITRRPPIPFIDIQNEAVRGCVPLAVDFSIMSEFGYEESIEWSFGDGEYTVEPEPYHLYDEAGTYFVRVEIKGDGGIFIDTAQIDVYPLPVPRFSITPTYVMLDDQEVQFYNTSFINWSNSEMFYRWDFGDGGSSTEKHPIYLYSVENLDGYPIKLVVTSDKGCMDSLTHDTRVIVDGSGYVDFPNAFLPVDGKMDGTYSELSDEVFRPKHYGVRDFELWVFNRWGEQVFYSDDILVGWNGRYGNNGKMLEQDVYFWKAKGKFNNGAPFKKAGDLTLIRR
ncbi:MAG: PKD domain-containing protein [Salinivirgaceae bacterium]